MTEAFELLVVGGGPAGLSAARGYRDAAVPVSAAIRTARDGVLAAIGRGAPWPS
jgi:hypothetical protein